MSAKRFDAIYEAMQRFVSQNGMLYGEGRIDADEAAVLARQIESIEKRVIETRYPDVKGLSLIPMIPGVDPGLMAGGTYTWRRIDKRGKAKFIANFAADFPRIYVDESENYTAVRAIGEAYVYSVPELRAFALAQRNGGNIALDARLAIEARHIMDRKIDELLAIGAADITGNAGIVGFANDSAITVLSTTGGAWGNATTGAPAATANQILADVLAMENQVYYGSQGTAVADTLALPIGAMRFLNSPLGVNNDKTIASYLKENSLCKMLTGKELDLQPWFQLNTAGSGSVPRAVCYQKDISVLGAVVPTLFEQLPPQPINAAFQVPCLASCGGTVIYYPPGVCYMDGIYTT